MIETYKAKRVYQIEEMDPNTFQIKDKTVETVRSFYSRENAAQWLNSFYSGHKTINGEDL